VNENKKVKKFARTQNTVFIPGCKKNNFLFLAHGFKKNKISHTNLITSSTIFCLSEEERFYRGNYT
jgi:hypothetical protein